MSESFDLERTFEKARNHLAALTSAHVGLWNIGKGDWTVDQETGVIAWSFPDGKIVSAPVQVIGTYNTLDSTFLWGWDHPSILEDLRHDAQAILRYAEKHGIEFLQQGKIGCTEDQAWDFAALATLVCDRQGAYRGPSGTTLVFMTFGQIEMRQG